MQPQHWRPPQSQRQQSSGIAALGTLATTTWRRWSVRTWWMASKSLRGTSRLKRQQSASLASWPSTTRHHSQPPSGRAQNLWSLYIWTYAGPCPYLHSVEASMWPPSWTTSPSCPSSGSSPTSQRQPQRSAKSFTCWRTRPKGECKPSAQTTGGSTSTQSSPSTSSPEAYSTRQPFPTPQSRTARPKGSTAHSWSEPGPCSVTLGCPRSSGQKLSTQPTTSGVAHLLPRS